MTNTAQVFERVVKTLDGVVEATCPVCGGGWFSNRDGERQGAIHHVECSRNGADLRPEQDART